MKCKYTREELYNKCGVYRIYCVKTNKFYIGSSKNLWKRMITHIWSLDNKRHRNKNIQNEYNIYGNECFVFEIIEFCDEDKRLDKEQYYIDLYKESSKLYNLSTNAYTNNFVTEEQKRILSEIHKGKKISEEQRRKISETNKGRIVSEETRAKISKAQKGKVFSENHRLNISKSRIGRFNGADNTNAKTTYVYDLKHNLLYTFDTQKETAEFLLKEGIIVSNSKNPIDTVSSSIRRCMRNNRPYYNMFFSFDKMQNLNLQKGVSVK